MKNLKKKLFISIVILAAAVLLISGCSEDALKDRVPGVKANVNTLLADNEEGDLEYNVGELETEEDFTDENEEPFGTQIIEDIEIEFEGDESSPGIELIKEENNNLEGSGKQTIDENTSLDLASKNDFSDELEEINFITGDLVLEITDTDGDSNDAEITVDSIIVNGVKATINGNTARIPLNSGLDLTVSDLLVDYKITVNKIGNLGGLKFTATFENVEVENLKVELNNSFWENSDYDLSMNEILIEDYDKEDIIDKLTVSDSELYVDFEIADGINLNLSKVDVKSDPEITEYTFALAENNLTSESSRAYLDLNKIVSMLRDDNTKDVKIAGDIALSSDGAVTITKDSKLKVKNAVLESAELKIDNYQMEPEAAEEGLTADEVDDIKKGLDEVEVIIEGINNPLPADVDLKLYVKDAADTKSELYKAENKVTTFNLKANTSNGEDVMVIDKKHFDKFIGNDIYVGLELYSDFTFTKKEYSGKTVSVKNIKTEFNINLEADDLDE